MEEIQLQLSDNNNGRFFIENGNETLAEMIFKVSKKQIIVSHTEVSKQLEGKGVGKKLVSALVEYARSTKMQVIPLCPFVYAQFKGHDEYADLLKGE